jgi:branched-subunit amino acid ABC-type transport system permease component
LSKKILIIAALISVVASAAYACLGVGHPLSYSLCRQISLVGVPGILIAAVVSMTLLGGVHGGGPLGMLLIIATPVNFLLYVGLGIAARAVWRLLTKTSAGSTHQ